MGFNCLNATKPPGGDSLLFANKSPEISGTPLINLRKIKAEFTLEPTSSFELGTPRLGIH